MPIPRARSLGWILAAALTGALLLAASAQAATVTKTAVPMKASGYSYMQVAHGGVPGFEAPAFDDTTWATGAAGFGNLTNQCAFSNSNFISTIWAANTDMLLRRSFTLPAGATNLHVHGTVDNVATVFLNGDQVGSSSSGNCIADTLDFTADPSSYHAGSNLLAVRAVDLGSSTYYDQRITYDLPLYSVCLLYSTDKSTKLGATVPLKFYLCDEQGNDVSSPSITVHATGTSKLDGTAATTTTDSGNANPDSDFRYDGSLGPSGGYIFNKATKDLSTGTWKVAFTVDGDSEPGYVLQFDVR